MISEFEFLISLIGSNIISVLITSSLAVFIIQSLAKGRIDNYFSTKLEIHKSDLARELSLITERAKYENQRLIHDFGLYTNQRHQLYPELFKLALESIGYANQSVLGFRTYRSFEEYNTQDLENYLNNKNGFTSMMIEKWKTMWQNGERQKAVSEIHERFVLIEKHEARLSWNKAKSKWLLSALYLSEPVSTLYNEILTLINNILINSEVRYQMIDFTKIEEFLAEADIKMDKLKELMRDELSIGYYKGNVKES